MRQVVTLLLLLVVAWPVYAMRINADPRSILSYLDKSLSPELDILRVTTEITPDNHLVFQVKTKGDWTREKNSDYLVLNILHEKTYALIIPIQKDSKKNLSIYEGDLIEPGEVLTAVQLKESEQLNQHAEFKARNIARGAEFTIPLDWINFGADFSYDAYTVAAEMNNGILQINNLYDQARKGRPEENRISAITLINSICSPKK